MRIISIMQYPNILQNYIHWSNGVLKSKLGSLGFNPVGGGRYTPRMSSNKIETQISRFPSLRLTGWGLGMKDIRRAVNRTLLTRNFEYFMKSKFFIEY